MHHTLRFYSRNRELFLKYYIFQAKWTKIPLIGRLVRRVANLYGNRASRAYLLTFQEANEIVESSGSLALGPCTCRDTFKNCDAPLDAEIMVGVGRNVFMEERPHDYHPITRDEAREVLRKCHDKGLVHTIVRCRDNFYAICNCCPCCCVPSRLKREYGIGNALVRKGNIVEEVRQNLSG